MELRQFEMRYRELNLNNAAAEKHGSTLTEEICRKRSELRADARPCGLSAATAGSVIRLFCRGLRARSRSLQGDDDGVSNQAVVCHLK
jgi:hypothetical protein